MSNAQLPVSIERRERTAIVTLNRGDGRNALNTEAMTLLRDIALELARDPDLGVVIVRGEGAFSAGVDLSELAQGKPGAGKTVAELRELVKLGPAMCKAWEDIEAFTIAAIEGYCVGGAAALAASVDYRVLGESAFLRLPEVPLGINMSWQTIPRLVAQIGPARTKQYVILGKRIAAKQALDWGLCEEVTTDGKTLEAAQKLAAEILDLPPLPVRMTKQTVNAVANALSTLTSHMDRDQYLLTTQTQDFAEAVAAWRDKRKPKFTGN
ncbi:MAG: enoyl-CoA hydratase-related protein [Pseudomonadota bacterium]